MYCSVLRLTGNDPVLRVLEEECQTRLSGTSPHVNLRGDLVLTLSEGGEDWDGHLREVGHRMATATSVIEKARSLGCDISVDFGVDAPDSHDLDGPNLNALGFPHRFLATMAKLGADLDVTVYAACTCGDLVDEEHEGKGGSLGV